MVSPTVSPLAVELDIASEKPSTLPPSASMADSKERRVRVEGSKEEGGQLLVSTDGLVLDGVCDNVLGGGDQLIDFLHGQVGDVNEGF